MVVFTYMTHMRSIRGTQKKEHILMVEKRKLLGVYAVGVYMTW